MRSIYKPPANNNFHKQIFSLHILSINISLYIFISVMKIFQAERESRKFIFSVIYLTTNKLFASSKYEMRMNKKNEYFFNPLFPHVSLI